MVSVKQSISIKIDRWVDKLFTNVNEKSDYFSLRPWTAPIGYRNIVNLCVQGVIIIFYFNSNLNCRAHILHIKLKLYF